MKLLCYFFVNKIPIKIPSIFYLNMKKFKYFILQLTHLVRYSTIKSKTFMINYKHSIFDKYFEKCCTYMEMCKDVRVFLLNISNIPVPLPRFFFTISFLEANFLNNQFIQVCRQLVFQTSKLVTKLILLITHGFYNTLRCHKPDK